MRALLSVHDKTGLVDLARGLADLGWDLVASGNTSAVLSESGLDHRQVADVTGSPEMLGGRVKTLHPALHAGILADRSRPEHLEDLAAQDIAPIDLVVCNFYPFTSDPSVELIDVGGSAMVRAAAKNFAHVGVLTSPADYGEVLAELRATGSLSESTRRALARAAFARSAAYDAAVATWLDDERLTGPGTTAGHAEGEHAVAGQLPVTLTLALERAEVLRYGENPHQAGARYRVAGRASWWDAVQQLGGKELSYLNLFDAEAAWRLVHELSQDAGGRPAVAIIKHASPCGAAVADDVVAAYERALAGDPVAAFGGVVAIAGPVALPLAEAIAGGAQADVVLAAAFDADALDRLRARRKATRLLAAPEPEPARRQVRSLGNSVLVQEHDALTAPPSTWRVVTKVAPTHAQWADLVLAWRVCARTTSNAITVVRGGQAVGVGGGQPSRVEAARIAVGKAGEKARGASAASDAFFPFPDGLAVLAEAGCAAAVQPGGSIRDDEVTSVADAAGIAMVLTGERHFRH